MGLFTGSETRTRPEEGKPRETKPPEAPKAAAAAPTPRVVTPPIGAPAPQITARRLVVGREILVTGEIDHCDVLVVEGTVKADIAGCKELQIAEGGVFQGKALVETAEIRGRMEGELLTSGLLTIRSGGEVRGKVRYKDIVVERGGRIAGEVAEGLAKAA